MGLLNLAGQGPKRTAPAHPALSIGVRLDDVWRSLPFCKVTGSSQPSWAYITEETSRI